MKNIKKILIANRGDSALRILRTCKDMGISVVSVYSQADKNALHVKFADESVCIGPPQAKKSYLNIPAIISAAELTGCDAIHPGVGFLAENASFAKTVQDCGFVFIGPSAEHIEVMGNKISAKEFAKNIGFDTLESSAIIHDMSDAYAFFQQNGYPGIIKAAHGGGGKGMRIVHSESDIESNVMLAQKEAEANFGNADCYIEKFLLNPRHYEIQILGDMHGNVIHIGDRDCSMQRNHQKVVEESNVQYIDTDLKNKFLLKSAKKMSKAGYYNVGTLEFLYSDGRFYFMEMNTRLQVEHTVTEEIAGIDLVRQQIMVANGLKLQLKQDDVNFHGVALECRINAEDPKTFQASAGHVINVNMPSGPGVRVDTILYPGCTVPPFYDSMIAKIITLGSSRAHAIARMQRALKETFIDGISANTTMLQKIISHDDFINNSFSTNWLAKHLDSLM